MIRYDPKLTLRMFVPTLSCSFNGQICIKKISPCISNQHMWPLLQVGGGFGTERSVAVVASLSARVGSIGDNRLGGWHSYRSSKAALNQCTTLYIHYLENEYLQSMPTIFFVTLCLVYTSCSFSVHLMVLPRKIKRVIIFFVQ